MSTEIVLAEAVKVGDRILNRSGEWLTVETTNLAAPLNDHIRFTGHVDGDARRYTHFRGVDEEVERERQS